ncbi:CUE domain-containing protein [Paenibacillus sp. FSL K6-1330]|uniref:CUE domain-containing protein n=1 Tax=Paenibacillus sp. FSL K6-1330 TaxID=2975292 RepID=UPI0030DBDC04
MNSKFIAIVGAAVLTLGIGTAVYASEVAPSNFKDMIPFMKEMHPNLSDSDLEQMYNNCHGNSNTQGMMQNNSMMPTVNSGSIYN